MPEDILLDPVLLECTAKGEMDSKGLHKITNLKECYELKCRGCYDHLPEGPEGFWG